MRRLASSTRSSGVASSGARMTCRLSVIDRSGSLRAARRISGTASPCARFRWCTAASAAAPSVRPGAWAPDP